jgi:hypothetical protein
MRILKIGKSLIFGVEHYNMDDVSRVLNYVKKNFKPEDKIIFMGEGGDDNNVYEAGGEQEAIKNGLEAYFNNFINDFLLLNHLNHQYFINNYFIFIITQLFYHNILPLNFLS